MLNIIGFLVVGLVAGALARLLVPGEDKMSIGATLALGVIGSFVGGLLLVIFTGREFGDFQTTGLIGSVIGGIVALLVYRFMKSRA